MNDTGNYTKWSNCTKNEHHAEGWIQEEWGRQNTGSLWEEKDIQLSLTFVSLVAVISDPNISVTIDSTKNLLCHNRCVQNSKSAITTESLWKKLAWEGNTQHTALSLTAVGLVAVCQCGGRAWFGQRSAKWGILLLLLILLLPQRRGNKWWTLYPCSTKTREVLGNPSPTPKRFPETERMFITLNRCREAIP